MRVTSRQRSNLNGNISLLMLALLVLVAGCGLAAETLPARASADEPLVLTQRDDGRIIEVVAGQRLVLELDSNPSTGYSWEASEYDGQVLRQIGGDTFHPATEAAGAVEQRRDVDEPLLGAGGAQRFVYEATDAGETLLELTYHRPWESEETPLDLFTIKVVVS